jgi:carbamate kinase
VATLVTQVVVHADDAAFEHPTKPIGPVYDQTEASALASQRGWSVAPDGDGWRVSLPRPNRAASSDSVRSGHWSTPASWW